MFVIGMIIIILLIVFAPEVGAYVGNRMGEK